MEYFFIILALVAIGLIIYLRRKKDDEIVPAPISITGDEICAKLNLNEVIKNQQFVVGKDYSILLFKNDKCIYQRDDYKINANEMLDLMKSSETNNTKSSIPNENICQDVFTCYKVRKNDIHGIEFGYKSSTQFIDTTLGVLLKLRLAMRTSFKISNKELFIKDFLVFNEKMTIAEFRGTILSLLRTKIYGSVTSFLHQNKISYLHMSLYKYEIEKQLISDLNKYLSIYGITITKFSFQEITNLEDKYYKYLSDSILEKSKMDLLEYTYTEKMNFIHGIHEELKNEEEFSEAKVYIK